MYYILIILGIALMTTGIVGLGKNKKKETVNEMTNSNNKTISQNDDVNDSQNDAGEIGFKFECYTIDKFDKRLYNTLEWASDKKSENHYAERSKYPDFLIEDKQTKVQFLMECKYRSKWIKNSKGDDVILWVEQRKIDDYKYYGELKQADVIVVFGVGGSPDSPEEVFALPLNLLLKPISQRREFLSNFKVDKNKPFLFLPNKHNLAIMKSFSK